MNYEQWFLTFCVFFFFFSSSVCMCVCVSAQSIKMPHHVFRLVLASTGKTANFLICQRARVYWMRKKRYAGLERFCATSRNNWPISSLFAFSCEYAPITFLPRENSSLLFRQLRTRRAPPFHARYPLVKEKAVPSLIEIFSMSYRSSRPFFFLPIFF